MISISSAIKQISILTKLPAKTKISLENKILL